MLRLLGFVFLVIICVDTAPWGLVIGTIACVAWLFPPTWLSRFWAPGTFAKAPRVAGANIGSLNAIPLVNAVYCANCDAITDSPHESCRGCGSHSILAVARLWQLSAAHAPAGAARHKISFTADIRDIPAIGLSEAVNLIVRLTEMGGALQVFHIHVDDAEAEASNAPAVGQKIELVKPVARATTPRPRPRRKAS
ncbi:hypothetical protein Acid345_4385 [Candidatus Koribacter versatilis Ellin345]|uniref:Uncharacterized protein n=1 Tax=Koribacter versatilis (strain Ellin345) TaxID=204669 RepID=Q1IIB5_KORVE|nr:hypothetical protein [Candidatus Koribacter versatilis]ABF43385.1 hypothetical protein Acid345_4385 [Candidatus Koribacter versatilis Ellin345]